MALTPDQPLEARHEVELVEDQLRVDELPLVMEVGRTVRVVVGIGMGLTVMVMLVTAVPQVRV